MGKDDVQFDGVPETIEAQSEYARYTANELSERIARFELWAAALPVKIAVRCSEPASQASKNELHIEFSPVGGTWKLWSYQFDAVSGKLLSGPNPLVGASLDNKRRAIKLLPYLLTKLNEELVQMTRQNLECLDAFDEFAKKLNIKEGK